MLGRLIVSMVILSTSQTLIFLVKGFDIVKLVHFESRQHIVFAMDMTQQPTTPGRLIVKMGILLVSQTPTFGEDLVVVKLVQGSI